MESDAIYFYCHDEIHNVALVLHARFDRYIPLNGLVAPVLHILVRESTHVVLHPGSLYLIMLHQPSDTADLR
jgi:hypothetical protein